jgi:hypothetical protein
MVLWQAGMSAFRRHRVVYNTVVSTSYEGSDCCHVTLSLETATVFYTTANQITSIESVQKINMCQWQVQYGVAILTGSW